MNLNDLMEIMGKSREEIEQLLNENDVIELNLTEKKQREVKENNNIVILE